VPHLIAVDWGTSSLRGARLDQAGQVLEEKSAPLGIANVPNGDFAGVFASPVRGLDDAGRHSLLDLRHGRQPARLGRGALCRCPAGPGELVQRLHWIEPGRIADRSRPQRYADRCARRDARRGGADFRRDALAGLADGVFVLPGTHSKWATVRAGRVTGFRTFMTGEVYGLFSRHSILARTLDADAPLDEAAFRRGVARAGNGEGLLHNAFGVGRSPCSGACRPPNRRAISPGC
jgi:2-dehydro-3-deoxygalactonokinase